MTDVYTPDECCGKHIAKALLAGKLANTDTFVCPKCGCEWKARMVEDVRSWEPVTMIELL